MKTKIAAAALTAALTLGVGANAAGARGRPAGAGEGGQPQGVTCQQFGHAGLRSLGSPAQVARSLGAELDDLLALHRTDPASANALLSSLNLFDQAAIDAACPAH